MPYRLTTQKQIRAEFWQTFPTLPRRRIRDYSGRGKMHHTDTRVAFVDFIDALEREGDISPDLAQRATLD